VEGIIVVEDLECMEVIVVAANGRIYTYHKDGGSMAARERGLH
jgi:hypothetical protein